jgi:hypothetical protein
VDRNVSLAGVSHTVLFAVYSFLSDGINSVRFKNSGTDEKFFSETYRRPSAVPNPLFKRERRLFSWGKNGSVVGLLTFAHLVPILRTRRAKLSISFTPFWCVQGHFYIKHQYLIKLQK